MSGVGVKIKTPKGGGAPPLASALEGPRHTPPNRGDPRNAPEESGRRESISINKSAGVPIGSGPVQQRLDQVCEITMGQAPEGGAYNYDGKGWPLIAGAGDFGDVYPLTKKHTTEASKICRAGDIVLGIRASIGEKVLSDGEYCLGRGVAGLRAGKSIDSRFLWHWIDSTRSLLFSKAKGATFKQVNKDDIGELPIILPPLLEQRRIAEVLDRAEGLRAKRRESLILLENLSQGIFENIFGDPFSNSKNWKKKRLDECSDQINDCPHSTPIWTESGIICLRTSNLSEGDWNWSDKRFVSESTYIERSKRGKLEPGDIVLSREGTVGIAAIVGPGTRMCMGQRLVQIRADTSILLPEFLLKFLLSVTSPVRISQFMVGSTSQHLNVKDLRALSIPVPPLNLQQEFARRIAAVEKLKATHRASLAQLDALFASLQHRAFRGEL